MSFIFYQQTSKQSVGQEEAQEKNVKVIEINKNEDMSKFMGHN